LVATGRWGRRTRKPWVLVPAIVAASALLAPGTAGAFTGGTSIPARTKVTRIVCESGCPAATAGATGVATAKTGSVLRFKGRNLVGVAQVVFTGRVQTPPRRKASRWLEVRVPSGARSGRVVVVDAYGTRSRPSANAVRIPAPPPPPPSASPGAGSLGMPLPKGWILTSTFWEQRSYERHPGVDLAISTGTPILAAGAGTVTTAAPSGGYGNYICVRHSSTLSTCYAHASEMLVSAGDTVRRGQTIGRVGCTGNCTGPHLHYEVRVKGAVVCPAPWVGQSSSVWCEPDSPGYGTTAISAAVVARSASTYTLLGSGDGEVCNLRAKKLRGAGRVVSAKS
jgi:hypothetical protein